jgi:hypothetical protein
VLYTIYLINYGKPNLSIYFFIISCYIKNNELISLILLNDNIIVNYETSKSLSEDLEILLEQLNFTTLNNGDIHMNLIHIENKLVYPIYIFLFYISIVVWLISAIFSWPLWLIFILGWLTINFAWWALILYIEIAIENCIEKKFNKKEK